MKSWHSLAGLYIVDENGVSSTPKLFPNETKLFAKMVSRWKWLVLQCKGSIPESWVFGIMWAESKGNPNAVSKSGARGLMQVMPFNAPDSDLLNPSENMREACRLLEKARIGHDLVQVASIYNAGSAGGEPHKDDSKPFGLREQVPYIETVISGSNTYNLEDMYEIASIETPGPAVKKAGIVPFLLGGLVIWKIGSIYSRNR